MRMTRRPTPPGEILRDLYLVPHRVSITEFADAAGVSRKHVSSIINGRAAITAIMAVRFGVVLGTTPQYWLNLQNAVELFDFKRTRTGRKARRVRGLCA